MDYVGEIIPEYEREQRYGDGIGPYCIWEKLIIQKMVLTPSGGLYLYKRSSCTC